MTKREEIRQIILDVVFNTNHVPIYDMKANVLDKYIKAIENLFPSWIKVEDELPKDDGECIFIFKLTSRLEGSTWFDLIVTDANDAALYITNLNRQPTDEHITHWQSIIMPEQS